MISELEAQLEEAIERCDFSEAASIKSRITAIKAKNSNQTIQIYISSFADHAHDCKRCLEEELLNLDESIKNQEKLIRRKISDLFHELQVKHIEALIEVEKEHLLRIAKDKLRPVPEALNMKEQAKLAAASKKFEEALKLKEAAEKIEKDELERREEVVKNDYMERRKTVLANQKAEISDLTKQLNDSIYNLSKRKEFEVDQTYQRYKKNLGEALKNTKMFITNSDDDMKNECIKQCARIYKEIMADAFPQEYVESPPISGKVTAASFRSINDKSGLSPTRRPAFDTKIEQKL